MSPLLLCITRRCWRLVVAGLLLPGLPAAAAARELPNIVLILADDLGYGDIAGYGASDVKTPHLDLLATEGVRFTQFYGGGPECTPSRTALLTGRFPERAGGMECAIGVGNVGRYDHAINLALGRDLGLPPEEAVLAPALRRAGYVNGVFGKWHLGYEPKFNPLGQGFDEFFGFLGGFVDYFRHRELSDLKVLYRNREAVQAEGYMTHLITAEAELFIARHRDRPFFLYAAYGSPHFPFQAPDDGAKPPPTTWAEVYAGSRATYAAMVEDLDAQVGRLLASLERHGLARDTLVVFTSDHGAMPPGRNLPFARGKTTLFEGGLRVPAIVRWPARLPAGHVSHQPAWMMDLTASLLAAAGTVPPDERVLDGMDVLDHVAQGFPDFSRKFFWRFRRDAITWRAIRDGSEKYIHLEDGTRMTEWRFNLSADPAELHDYAASDPSGTERLRRSITDWEREVHTDRGR